MDERESFDDELQMLREKRLQEMKKSGAVAGVTEVIDETFDELVGSHPYVLIDFWAEWCGPCRKVAPVVEELAHEFAGKVVFGKCNTDDNPAIARRYMISAIPTLMLFANGQLADRVIGAYPKDAIRSRIVRAFSLQE